MKHPITTRKRQSGSVLLWILLIIMILIALVPIVLYISRVLQYSLVDYVYLPVHGPPKDIIEDGPFLDPPESGLTSEIDDAADSSVAAEPKPESENEAAEQTSDQQ